ncbi:CrcB family protein [Streptomyces sp. NPDC026206]|uniref:FluC/FEX family fluoride channel n=1 Tax=Streptomyces sp. NPDC026206 TaxID=3157089 RepID=UPI0034077D49
MEVPRTPVVVWTVSLGGGLGAAARYGACRLWPDAPGSFPWTTVTVNVVGCAAMGVLMVAVAGARATHALVRPFFATGVLGGFTTFSTYVADAQTLMSGGRPAAGLACTAGTPLVALAAAWSAARAARRLRVPGRERVRA